MTTTTTSSSTFTLTAPPTTDIWRKPPTTDVFNAPHTLGPAFPLKDFRSARITISALFEQRYDQGGLLFLLTNPTTTTATGTAGTAGAATKWLKTGMELYQGLPRISTVACDAWADWSIYPLSSPSSSSSSSSNLTTTSTSTTVEIRREGDELGKSLWVYFLDSSGERQPLREVNFVFAEEEDGWEVSVGGYAARPASGEVCQGKGLEVVFEGFEVVRGV